jgi:hypothetical protein
MTDLVSSGTRGNAESMDISTPEAIMDEVKKYIQHIIKNNIFVNFILIPFYHRVMMLGQMWSFLKSK